MTEQVLAEQRIGQNTEVTLHFALRLENGDTVDSTFDKAPATFKVGDGNLLPGFEAALFGFKAGDKRTLTVEPENAFGQPNPQNVQIIPRSQFADMELSPGLLVIFNDAANTELPGVVKEFDDAQVTIDFNHPLAGKTLTFDVEIILRQSAVTDCIGQMWERACSRMRCVRRQIVLQVIASSRASSLPPVGYSLFSRARHEA